MPAGQRRGVSAAAAAAAAAAWQEGELPAALDAAARDVELELGVPARAARRLRGGEGGGKGGGGGSVFLWYLATIAVFFTLLGAVAVTRQKADLDLTRANLHHLEQHRLRHEHRSNSSYAAMREMRHELEAARSQAEALQATVLELREERERGMGESHKQSETGYRKMRAERDECRREATDLQGALGRRSRLLRRVEAELQRCYSGACSMSGEPGHVDLPLELD